MEPLINWDLASRNLVVFCGLDGLDGPMRNRDVQLLILLSLDLSCGKQTWQLDIPKITGGVLMATFIA
jgi:hypothetical protein